MAGVNKFEDYYFKRAIQAIEAPKPTTIFCSPDKWRHASRVALKRGISIIVADWVPDSDIYYEKDPGNFKPFYDEILRDRERVIESATRLGCLKWFDV